MKKLILFFVYFIVSTSYTFSQLNIGVHGVFTVGNAKYQAMIPGSWNNPTRMHDLETKSETSLSLGGLVETRLYSFLYLQAEVNLLNHSSFSPYSRWLFGSYDPNSGGGWFENITYSFKYIELPILLKMKFDYNKFLPYCFAGVGIRLLNKATETYQFISSPDYYYKHSVSEFTKHGQSFVIFGIGIDYVLNDVFNIFATIRYSNSLVDIAEVETIYFKPDNYDFLVGVKTNIFDY